MLLTTASPPRRLAGLLGVLAALCGCLLLGGATPAAAHAVITGSSPASGSVVSSAPRQVTVTFSEDVALSDDSLRVLGPHGERADTGKLLDLRSDGTVRYGTPLRNGLADGTYTVAWQAVSADSHPVSGAFTFSIGAPSKTTAVTPQEETGGGTVGLLYDIGRYASYAGFVLPVGGAAFVLACWPPGARVRAVQRLVVGGWVTLTAATLALLLLRTPYTGSGALADAFDLGGLSDVVPTKTGTALVSRLLLLAAAALFLSVLFGRFARGERDSPGAAGGTDGGRSAAERRDLRVGLGLGGTVVAAGLATTWAMSEHASTGIQTAVAMPVDVVHLLAVAAWLGGLAALLTALYGGGSGTDLPRGATRRFSRLALGSVAVLAATGLYQSWRQVGSWSALTGTEYGVLLLAKVGLIGGLVCLGGFSRRWTQRLDDAPGPGGSPEAAALDAVGVPLSRAAAEGGGGSSPVPPLPETGAPPRAPDTVGGSAPPGPRALWARALRKPRRPAADADADSGIPVPGTEVVGGSSEPDHPHPGAPEGRGEGAPVPSPEPSGPGRYPHLPGSADMRLRRVGWLRPRTPIPGLRPRGPAGTAKPPGGSPPTAPGEEPGTASPTTAPEPGGAASPTTSPAGAPAAGHRGHGREAQLARQRDAVAAARRKQARDADPQRVGLRRSVLAEAGVAVVVLAVATALAGTEPGRTAEQTDGPPGPSTTAPDRPVGIEIPFDTGGPQGAGTAQLTLDPGRTGRNTLHVRATGPQGRPLDAPEVKLAFTLPAKDLGPLRVTPQRLAAGRWTQRNVQLPVPGRWELAFTIRTSDIDQVTETRTVTIG